MIRRRQRQYVCRRRRRKKPIRFQKVWARRDYLRTVSLGRSFGTSSGISSNGSQGAEPRRERHFELSAPGVVRIVPQPPIFGCWILSKAEQLGLVPRQHSSGGKPKLPGISQRGNQYLRKLLLEGARAGFARLNRSQHSFGPWMDRLGDKKHSNGSRGGVGQQDRTYRMGRSDDKSSAACVLAMLC
jgi:hypothetical protein